MIRWHTAKKEALKGAREEPDDWDTPKDLEMAWGTWTLLEATGWRHLPFVGGLLDQPDVLMTDLATISWLSAIVEDILSGDGGD